MEGGGVFFPPLHTPVTAIVQVPGMRSPFRAGGRRFAELSYANASQPRLKRWLIRSVEGLSGRDRFATLYEIWRDRIAPSRDRVFTRMLDLVGITVAFRGEWPVADLPDGPLVIVANHPFGIGDGIAVLSLAEQLGRPFRVMINAELMKVPEVRDYSLPVDFDETPAALRNNLAVRQEAMRLLMDGTTIVVFPAGGVATAPNGFGRARDLPWKMFPARMIRQARANVLPVHFGGQNGPLFHIASRFSVTLRVSLLIREFARLSGRSIEMTVGRVIGRAELEEVTDRKALTRRLHDEVFALAPRLSRRPNPPPGPRRPDCGPARP